MNPPHADSQPPDDVPFKPDIVSHIPLHPAAGAPLPINDGENLDEIMQDVGHQLKKEDNRPAKKHFFFRRRHHEKDLKFTAQPILSAPPETHSQPVRHHPPAPAEQHHAVKPQSKPRPKTTAPIMVIIMTIIVTGILIAAAFSASK